jgi:hypothetical protein
MKTKRFAMARAGTVQQWGFKLEQTSHFGNKRTAT